jgi:hypothetical protein
MSKRNRWRGKTNQKVYLPKLLTASYGCQVKQ